MAELFPIPIAEQVAEIERELRAREHVYPKLIAKRAMTHAAAERQTARLKAAVVTLNAAMLTAPPVPEVAGSIPVVLYFRTKNDVDEFVAVVRDAFVNPVEIKLP